MVASASMRVYSGVRTATPVVQMTGAMTIITRSGSRYVPRRSLRPKAANALAFNVGDSTSHASRHGDDVAGEHDLGHPEQGHHPEHRVHERVHDLPGASVD